MSDEQTGFSDNYFDLAVGESRTVMLRNESAFITGTELFVDGGAAQVFEGLSPDLLENGLHGQGAERLSKDACPRPRYPSSSVQIELAEPLRVARRLLKNGNARRTAAKG